MDVHGPTKRTLNSVFTSTTQSNQIICQTFRLQKLYMNTAFECLWVETNLCAYYIKGRLQHRYFPEKFA